MLITEDRLPENGPSVSDSRFARPSLRRYSTLILEQAGIDGLCALSYAFLGDPGREVSVCCRETGTGYQFTEPRAVSDECMGSGWLLFEKRSDETIRARVFRTLAGASAEFSVRLGFHDRGDVSMRELAEVSDGHRGRQLQVTFEGADARGTSAMVLAPLGVALDTASRLFSR